MEPMLLRYDRASLKADLWRAAVGLLLTAGPLIAFRPHPIVAAALTLFAILFAIYGARAFHRLDLAFEVTDETLRVRHRWTPERAIVVPWAELTGLDLAFYAPRRKRPQDGWMEMKLRAGRRTVRVESTLDDFDELAERAAAAARARGLRLSEPTVANLTNMGIDAEED